MDSRFVNSQGHDQTGRLFPYWARTDSGIELSALVDYNVSGAGDYYLLALQSGKETVLEPFEYEISGKKVLMTTLAVPIKNLSGKVVGVAGIDISLDTLNNMSYNAGSYKSAKISLLLIMAHM